MHSAASLRERWLHDGTFPSFEAEDASCFRIGVVLSIPMTQVPDGCHLSLLFSLKMLFGRRRYSK